MKSLNLDEMRRDMVEGQLAGRGISDRRVLDAFLKVPRHRFVSEGLAPSSYSDCPLPTKDGQTISQPYMVALMTQSLGLKGGEQVLEIGTGSGYQLAILAEIAGYVYSIERFEGLAKDAAKIVSELGYKNFEVKVGDGTLGWDQHMPYDGIIVTAGAPHIPKGLLWQLKDGGRMVIPVGGDFGQMLTVVERKGKSFESREVCGCVFVPLIGKEGWHE